MESILKSLRSRGKRGIYIPQTSYRNIWGEAGGLHPSTGSSSPSSNRRAWWIVDFHPLSSLFLDADGGGEGGGGGGNNALEIQMTERRKGRRAIYQIKAALQHTVQYPVRVGRWRRQFIFNIKRGGGGEERRRGEGGREDSFDARGGKKETEPIFAPDVRGPIFARGKKQDCDPSRFFSYFLRVDYN